jgi:hypothetical protein
MVSKFFLARNAIALRETNSFYLASVGL